MTHVLHIRKTGGSALFDALSPWAASHGLVLHPHGVRLLDIPRTETVVFTVRDSESRFCSGFNSRLRCGRPRNDIPWTAAETIAFARFPTPDHLAMALSSPTVGLRRAAQEAMSAIPHLVPLGYWLGSVDEIERRTGRLIVLSQSSLTADFARLKILLKAPHAELPDDDIRAHRTPEGFSTALSLQARLNIAEFYKEDALLYERCLSERMASLSPRGAVI